MSLVSEQNARKDSNRLAKGPAQEPFPRAPGARLAGFAVDEVFPDSFLSVAAILP